jgi:hypothetical protein
MPDGKSLAVIYSYLHASQLFRNLRFNGDSAQWDQHFHATQDIQQIVNSLADTLEDDQLNKRKRIVGVRANIGDGKTTLLNYLKYKFPKTFPLYLQAIAQSVSEGDNDDLWKVLRMLVLLLFYEMRNRKLIKENDYLEAVHQSNQAKGGEEIQAAVCKYLRKYYDSLRGTYPMWLCDNIKHPGCLTCFKFLMDLQDLEPPFNRFFDSVSVLVIFSTIDRGVQTAWQTMIESEVSGHLSHSLRVRQEDALGIVTKILQGCAATSSPDVQAAFRQCQATSDTALYPFVKDDLTFFLGKKAKKVLLSDSRLDVKAEVAEIQLRNTLNLLQRAVDKMKQEGNTRPVDLKDLESADSKP